MPVCTLNGIDTRLARDPEGQHEIVGDTEERSFTGYPVVSRRALKETIRASTTPTSEVGAECIRGIVMGRGDKWTFDTADTTYSAKGIGAAAGAVVTSRASTGADGSTVSGEVKYGTACVAVESGTTNLLLADSRDAENAPTGYSAVAGATIGASATHYWQGTKSVSCVTGAGADADREGVWTDECDPGAASATKTYTGSVYIKGAAGGESVSVYLRDSTSGVNGTSTVQVLTTAGVWYRVTCSITIGGVACRAMRLVVLETTQDSGITFYCDGWQIEEKAYATSWVDGTRAAGVLTAGASPIQQATSNYTLAAWVNLPTENPIAAARIMRLRSSASEDLIVQRPAGTNNLQAQTIGTVTGTATYSTNPWNGVWHHIAVVVRGNPEVGETALTVYLDGASVATASPASTPTMPAGATLYIGSYGAGTQLEGRIDDAVVLPYAATAAMVAAMYARTTSWPAPPIVELGGDIIPESARNCLGLVTKDKRAGYFDAGTYRTNGRVLDLELRQI